MSNHHAINTATLKFIAALLCSVLLSSCTWVKKTPGAEKVRLVPMDRVADCRKIGSVKTYTQDKISIVNRSAEKVRTELETLAMIEAAESGADTIVATSGVVNGQQTFNQYQCLK